jgi:hypothetical protein
MYSLKQFQRMNILRACSLACASAFIILMTAVPYRTVQSQNTAFSDFKLSNFIHPAFKRNQSQGLTTRTSNKTPNMKQCISNTVLNAAYSQSAATELQNLNMQVDSLRQAAQISGETYQSFDSQANSLFNNYNLQSTENYAAYIKSLGGCSSYIAAPIDFSMFTP